MLASLKFGLIESGLLYRLYGLDFGQVGLKGHFGSNPSQVHPLSLSSLLFSFPLWSFIYTIHFFHCFLLFSPFRKDLNSRTHRFCSVHNHLHNNEGQPTSYLRACLFMLWKCKSRKVSALCCLEHYIQKTLCSPLLGAKQQTSTVI